jgi:hypothetical protein
MGRVLRWLAPRLEAGRKTTNDYTMDEQLENLAESKHGSSPPTFSADGSRRRLPSRELSRLVAVRFGGRRTYSMSEQCD